MFFEMKIGKPCSNDLGFFLGKTLDSWLFREKQSVLKIIIGKPRRIGHYFQHYFALYFPKPNDATEFIYNSEAPRYENLGST